MSLILYSQYKVKWEKRDPPEFGAQKRGSPPHNLTARNLILANGVPQREQDRHALEKLEGSSKQLAFCRVLL